MMAWKTLFFDLVAAAVPVGSGESSSGSSFINMLAAAMFAVALFLMISSLLRKRGSSKNGSKGLRLGDAEPAERIQALRKAAEGRQTLDTVMAQSEELARRLASIMDGKAMALERHILDADERIARLEELEARRDGSGRGDAQQRVEVVSGTMPRVRDAESAHLGIGGESDPIKRRIFELADLGKSAVEIARETEQPTGQVELILALRSA